MAGLAEGYKIGIPGDSAPALGIFGDWGTTGYLSKTSPL